MKKLRNITAGIVLLVTLMGAACPQAVDRMKKLSDTISLFEPFVQALNVVPEKLKPIIADGKDLAKVSSDLTADFSAATTRGQKFAAADKAQKAATAIINRGHFAVDQRVMGVVNMISAAFSSVASFYSDAPSVADVKPSEKEFLKDLDAKIEELRRQMKQ